ncbi:hypothetical protein [Vibrio sp. V15_P4S5T153]|uniref:hypothetical protein n=2 Tax=unclassified Vibrio TaxID=2614977 RepID=UPI000B8F9AAB|nr:hypothetical protein [Vibrio sp. V15_P4S5T153]OXX65175.1 hypothetical protein B9J89_04610 [Vibrio sp. V15_P4S5T153]
MVNISYFGNKAIDYKLNVFAQLELEKLNNLENKIKLESLNEQTDELSRLLHINHNIFVKNKVIEIPDNEISDCNLNNLIRKVRARNGDMYFDDIDEIRRPLTIERIKKNDGSVFVEIKFSSDPATVSFLHKLNSEGLLGGSDRKNLPKIDSITPPFFVSNRNAVMESFSNGSNHIDVAKMICRDFINQKPEFVSMNSSQKIQKRTETHSIDI